MSFHGRRLHLVFDSKVTAWIVINASVSVCVCVCVRVRVKERERELRRSDHQRSGGESSPIGTQLLISLKISHVSNHVENLHLSLNFKIALVTKYHYEISNVTLNFEK